MTDDQIDQMLAEVHAATLDAQSAARGMGLIPTEARELISDARRLTVRSFLSQAGIMPPDVVCNCRVDETCRICDPVWPCESPICQFAGTHNVTECCPTARKDAAYRRGLEARATVDPLSPDEHVELVRLMADLFVLPDSITPREREIVALVAGHFRARAKAPETPAATPPVSAVVMPGSVEYRSPRRPCGERMAMRGAPAVFCDLIHGHTSSHEGPAGEDRWWFDESGCGVLSTHHPVTNAPLSPNPERFEPTGGSADAAI